MMNSKHSPKSDAHFLAIPPPTPPQLKPTNSNQSLFSNLSTVSTRNRIRTIFSKRSVSSSNLQHQVSRQSNLSRNISKPLSFLSTNISSTSINSNSSRFRNFFKKDKSFEPDEAQNIIRNRHQQNGSPNLNHSQISININNKPAGISSHNSSPHGNGNNSDHSHKLKRFFKKVVKGDFDHHHHHNNNNNNNNNNTNNNRANHNNNNNNSTKGKKTGESPLSITTNAIPETISTKLTQKYGPLGKLLGSGAGGSVSIVTNPTTNKTYAVKKFRPKLEKESSSDYHQKVSGEYLIGSSLNHQNLIHTIELIQDKMSYYVVMEYCQYDFFTIVMSGLMQRNEVACYFKQIINGVDFLHRKGLAHRDLKLDNCVVDNNGILKLIDFGSAVMFKYPDSDSNIQAKGIVGSDPYLAPEVLQTKYYDPTPVDIWSIAIIFCCMTLRRFPWKAPKLSDPSYKSFVTNPEDETASSSDSNPNNKNALPEPSIETSPNSEKNKVAHANSQISKNRLKGPYRLLRLLPHQSRTLIGDMLEIEPEKRMKMSGILSSEFFTSISICSMNGDGNCAKSDTHIHNLVTEEHLEKLNQERERTKKLKNQGVV